VMGEYEEFKNLCFVDTLNNVAALRAARGTQADLFGAVSEENVERIKRQNARRISVIIGNPPYNANQLNENDNNKNRDYPEIDRRIKATYVAASNAQKTKLYDMYARFLRWASDRVDENGIVAFVTNRSFIDRRTFDGFRKTIAEEFSDIYIVDFGGDVRDDPRLSGTKHNVFGIQTGVAISFMVKRQKGKGVRIHYSRRPQLETAEEKIQFLSSTRLANLIFSEVSPGVYHDWLAGTSDDFSKFIPVASEQTKLANKASHERAIFKTFSLGLSTNRDEWLYGINQSEVSEKVEYIIGEYEKRRNIKDTPSEGIKWSETLKRRRAAGQFESFDPKRIGLAAYRPFCTLWLYRSSLFIDRPGLTGKIYPIDDCVPRSVPCILFTGPAQGCSVLLPGGW
jgi:predicted helicase